MKTSFLLGISMLVFSLAFGASGIYDNNIALKINGSNTNYYYGSHCTNNLGGCVGSASPISPNFESSILSNVLTLSIDWLEVRTYKNGSDDITGANLYYRVFQTGHIPGSFFQESISFGADIGGGDQRWTENVTINLITGLLASTNYKLEIYSTAPFTYSGGSGTHLNDAGGNYFELTFTTSAALPIELTSFKSLKKNGGVTQLLWSTSSEINNSHFEVERSANGSDWELLANVDGYGTTTTPRDYVFEDRTPLAGLNYYRLRQVDFDGTFTFSPVVVESMETLDASALQVWPVPAATTVNLRWNGAVETTVEVLDAQGRLLRTLRIAPNGQFELPVGEFSSSLLFLRTVNAQGEVSIRKVVLM